MKSFELHFNLDGQVLINNIKVDNPLDCQELTKPYTDNFDGDSETQNLLTPEIITTNPDEYA